MFHERMKHINVRYHFIREIVESKEIEVAKIGKKDNAVDAFTKVAPGPKFCGYGVVIVTLLFETLSIAYQCKTQTETVEKLVGRVDDEEKNGGFVGGHMHATHGHVHGPCMSLQVDDSDVLRYMI
ncbi:hypothetical protein Tco_0804891 [Tanacetum coccineum]